MDGFRYNFKGTICILGKSICCIEKLFRIVQRFPEKYFVVTVPPEQLQNTCLLLRFTRRGGLVHPASKSSRFSHHPLRVPKAWHRNFAACGQRSGLLALNLANIFEKLLDQKTFICLRLVIENQLSNKFAPQIWAARPHLGSICEKLLHRKTFQFACGLHFTANLITDKCPLPMRSRQRAFALS